MQALGEEYLKYWGFESHPFLLSPQPSMFYEGGQYFECLERLRYAVKTQKGGVLIVSEEAGLGKTTIVQKLIEEMKDAYGDNFKFALIEHPVLTPEQIIAYIKREITETEPYDDKLKNLIAIKHVLSELFNKGGKCIIAVDEAHMLKDYPSVLQELRMLINLTYKEKYLHTFIISGQKPLWNTLSGMKEFWQRLPVKYYLSPLKLDETKNLLLFRIKKAGCKRDDLYTDEALELIHRASGGCPRTILALSDVSLLVGYSNLVQKIGEKEVAKAIEITSGRGNALPYARDTERKGKALIEKEKDSRRKIEIQRDKKGPHLFSSTFFFILFVFIIPLSFVTAYLYRINHEFRFDVPDYVWIPKESVPATEEMNRSEKKRVEKKEAFIKVAGANVRTSPDVSSQRIAVLMKGERIEILDEKRDERGEIWFMIGLLGKREGWVSEKVVEIRAQ